jgi:hypothetical protein
MCMQARKLRIRQTERFAELKKKMNQCDSEALSAKYVTLLEYICNKCVTYSCITS